MRSDATRRTAHLATVLRATFLAVMLLADIALAALTTGLVANWTFDACTAADSSGNNLNGTIVGDPMCLRGVVGTALSFDGVDDYFEVGDAPPLHSISGYYTFSLASWINIREWSADSFGGWFNLIDKYESAGDFGWIFFAHRATASLVLQTNGGGAGCPFLAPLHEWLHLAITFNGTDAVFYVNGEPECQASASPNLSATGPLYVGFSPSGGDDFLNGLLDELRLYNRALALSEVRELFAGCESGVCIGRITPSRGGDTGSVTTTIAGQGFTSGASVRLMRTGEPDVVGVVSAVNVHGSVLTATFDLTGRARGEWDVVVDNGRNIVTLENGFTVEEGLAVELWADIIGRSSVRPGRPATFGVLIGNRANIDARAVPASDRRYPRWRDVAVDTRGCRSEPAGV
jgi:concanavalin A-like lectin/glucanase superfamily protein